MTIQVAVGISGRGRSLSNLLKHQKKPDCPYKIVGVISSNKNCVGNDIAQEANLPLFYDNFKNPCVEKISNWIEKHNVQLIALAGFLRPFPVNQKWDRAIINIHPALLPDFGGKGMYGKHVHKAVLQSGLKVSGATIHYVTNEYDKGQIIAQIQVPVFSEDNPDVLAERVFKAECQLYPAALSGLAKGSLPLKGQKIFQYQFKSES